MAPRLNKRHVLAVLNRDAAETAALVAGFGERVGRETGVARAAHAVVGEQVARPRHVPGVDWGALRRVLCRDESAGKELWWRESCKVWSARSSVTARVWLALVYADGRYHRLDSHPRTHATLATGCRLSLKLLAAHAAAIDEFFGVPVAHLLHPRRTVTISAPS